MSAINLMKLFLFLLIISVVSTSLLYTTSETLVDSLVTTDGTTSASIFTMIEIFFKIVTFQIPDIPLLLNLFVFQPIGIGMLYTIILILKDLVPFT